MSSSTAADGRQGRASAARRAVGLLSADGAALGSMIGRGAVAGVLAAVARGSLLSAVPAPGGAAARPAAPDPRDPEGDGSG